MGHEKSSSDKAGSRARLEPARLEAALLLGSLLARAWALPAASTPTAAGTATGCAARLSAAAAVRLRVLRLTGEPPEGSIVLVTQAAGTGTDCLLSLSLYMNVGTESASVLREPLASRLLVVGDERAAGVP